MSSLNSRELGIEFEKRIQWILEKTHLPVLNETSVRSKYGNHISAIDHLIEKNDFLFAFQDKWRGSKPGIESINHFIQCVNKISETTTKKCIGIYLSQQPLTAGSKMAFLEENSKNKNVFTSISNNEPKLLFRELMLFLYSYSIYYFESDGSTIMYV